jgi:hypothetical protein
MEASARRQMSILKRTASCAVVYFSMAGVCAAEGAEILGFSTGMTVAQLLDKTKDDWECQNYILTGNEQRILQCVPKNDPYALIDFEISENLEPPVVVRMLYQFGTDQADEQFGEYIREQYKPARIEKYAMILTDGSELLADGGGWKPRSRRNADGRADDLAPPLPQGYRYAVLIVSNRRLRELDVEAGQARERRGGHRPLTTGSDPR